MKTEPRSKEKSKELKRLFTRLSSQCAGSGLFKEPVLVFGSGPVPCDLMVIGEAPGRDETKEGLPFVGKAGRFLISTLKDVFGKGREGFYITNVVKVWPKIETKRLKTRKPLREEEEFFIPYLKKEIDIVSPKAILAVGKTAFSALAPEAHFSPGEWVKSGGLLIMPVYHPSYLLRRQKRLKESTEKLKAAFREVKKKIS